MLKILSWWRLKNNPARSVVARAAITWVFFSALVFCLFFWLLPKVWIILTTPNALSVACSCTYYLTILIFWKKLVLKRAQVVKKKKNNSFSLPLFWFFLRKTFLPFIRQMLDARTWFIIYIIIACRCKRQEWTLPFPERKQNTHKLWDRLNSIE